jgi:hypothetical protein
MTLPDVTIVTSCYCFHNKFRTRSILEINDSIEIILSLPVYLVIFTDSLFYQIIKSKREKFGLIDQTLVVNVPFENTWASLYFYNVASNRNKYHAIRHDINCPYTHCIQCNKFDFLLQIINMNPFGTSKVGWLDGFVGINGKFSIYQGDDYIEKFVHTLNSINDKFRITILDVNDKRYKQDINKREYYSKYRYVVYSGFFTSGIELAIPILKRLKEIFVHTTNLGYGHGDEMLYLEILDEFDEYIDKAYGDYHYILNNFINPVYNLGYIYTNIIKKYLLYERKKECNECCKSIIESNKKKIAKSDGNDLLFNKISEIYVKTYT